MIQQTLKSLLIALAIAPTIMGSNASPNGNSHNDPMDLSTQETLARPQPAAAPQPQNGWRSSMQPFPQNANSGIANNAASSSAPRSMTYRLPLPLPDVPPWDPLYKMVQNGNAIHALSPNMTQYITLPLPLPHGWPPVSSLANIQTPSQPWRSQPPAPQANASSSAFQPLQSGQINRSYSPPIRPANMPFGVNVPAPGAQSAMPPLHQGTSSRPVTLPQPSPAQNSWSLNRSPVAPPLSLPAPRPLPAPPAAAPAARPHQPYINAQIHPMPVSVPQPVNTNPIFNPLNNPAPSPVQPKAITFGPCPTLTKTSLRSQQDRLDIGHIFKDLNYLDMCKMRCLNKKFDRMSRSIEMPKGKKWVAHVKEMLTKPVRKTIIEKGVTRVIEEPEHPEVIIEKLVSACAHCNNPIAELRTIVNLYFTDVPVNRRIWGVDATGKQAVIIPEKETLCKEFAKLCDDASTADAGSKEQIKERLKKIKTELFECVKELQPYAIADYILYLITGRNFMGTAAPFILHAINPQELTCDCIGQWLLKRPAKITRILALYAGQVCSQNTPAMYECLSAQSTAGARSDRLLIEKAMVSNRSDNTVSKGPACPEAERLDISEWQQKIKMLRACANGEIFKENSLSSQEIEASRLKAQITLRNLLTDRYNACCDSILQAKDAVQGNKLYQHAVWLIEQLLQERMITPLHASRKIAGIIRSREGRPTSDIQKGAEYAERAVDLATKDHVLNKKDLTDAATHYGILRKSTAYNIATRALYTKKYAALNERVVHEFSPQSDSSDFYLAARSLNHRAEINLADGNIEEATQSCIRATDYLDKSLQLLSKQTDQHLKASFDNYKEFKNQALLLARKIPAAAALAQKAEEYVREVKRRVDPLEQPD